MTLELLSQEFTVCQLENANEADLASPFTFFARTDEEISLVCPAETCPPTALNRQDGWRCLRVKGPLDFSLIGILSRLSSCLAEAGVPIFAVSTYNTDYLLFRSHHKKAAIEALSASGYCFGSLKTK